MAKKELKEQLEQLLKELIDKGIIYEWYNNVDGYHWSYTKEEENEEYELPEPFCEKHYRPFRDCDELCETFEKKWEAETGSGFTVFPKLYKPCIWVKSKAYGVDNLITAFDNDNESIGGSCVFLQDSWFDMQELFDNFTFLDGSPVGKLEEE